MAKKKAVKKKKAAKKKLPTKRLGMASFCEVCNTPITQADVDHNAGHCDECAFEAWGEGEPD
jgi:hypothetical protein